MDTVFDTLCLALRIAREFGPLGRPTISQSEHDRARKALDETRARLELGDFPGWCGARQMAAMDALATLVGREHDK